VATRPHSTVTLAFQRKLVRPEDPPVLCNFAVIARVGADVTMELGFFDPVEMANTLEAREESDTSQIPTQIFVTHRFSISESALRMLKEGLDRVLIDLNQRGEREKPERQ